MHRVRQRTLVGKNVPGWLASVLKMSRKRGVPQRPRQLHFLTLVFDQSDFYELLSCNVSNGASKNAGMTFSPDVRVNTFSGLKESPQKSQRVA